METDGSFKKLDVYARVTDEIVRAIEAGAKDYEMPWHQRAGAGLPKNALTGNHYRGGNTVALWATGRLRGYAQPYWGTFLQWEKLGARIRRGEKASVVVFYKREESAPNDEVSGGAGESRRILRAPSSSMSSRLRAGRTQHRPMKIGQRNWRELTASLSRLGPTFAMEAAWPTTAKCSIASTCQIGASSSTGLPAAQPKGSTQFCFMSTYIGVDTQKDSIEIFPDDSAIAPMPSKSWLPSLVQRFSVPSLVSVFIQDEITPRMLRAGCKCFDSRRRRSSLLQARRRQRFASFPNW